MTRSRSNGCGACGRLRALFSLTAMLTAMLTGAGHAVAVAADGQEAVDAVVREDFDIVLMDVQMPVMDGIEATGRIRALPVSKRGVPIVALTADALHGAAGRYLHAGMDGYVSKPVVRARLFSEMARVARPAAAEPGIDMAAIDALRTFMSPEQVRDLLAESMADMTSRISRLGACLDGGDIAGAAKQAHDLISVAGNCGAERLSHLARDVERACKTGEPAAAGQAFAEVRAVAPLALDALAATRQAIVPAA